MRIMGSSHLPSTLIARQDTADLDPVEIDFSSNSPRILAIVGTLTALAILLVVLRCYVRIFVLRRFYIEDGIMVAAMVDTFRPLERCLPKYSPLPLSHSDLLRRCPCVLRRRKSSWARTVQRSYCRPR